MRCNVGLCPNERAPGSAQCLDHRRALERDRGTSAERGYNSKRWLSTKRTVKRRDPFCTCTEPNCHNENPDGGGCMQVSTDVDHHPEGRKELLARGVKDPDDPKFCRGLCHSCHSRKTARERH